MNPPHPYTLRRIGPGVWRITRDGRDVGTLEDDGYARHGMRNWFASTQLLEADGSSRGCAPGLPPVTAAALGRRETRVLVELARAIRAGAGRTAAAEAVVARDGPGV